MRKLIARLLDFYADKYAVSDPNSSLAAILCLEDIDRINIEEFSPILLRILSKAFYDYPIENSEEYYKLWVKIENFRIEEDDPE